MDATTPGDRHLPSLQPLPEAEINGLIRRGEAAFALGNLALAREAFERVTDAGNALGALRLGQTFDPAVLAAAKLDKEPTDPGKAVYWYNRAHELALASAPEKIPPTPTTERTPPPVSTAARPIETVPPAAAGSATSTEIPEGAGTSSGSASPVASVVTPDIAVTAPVSRENGSELAVVTPQNNAVAPVTAAPATAASNDTQAVAANRGASIVNASKLIARGDTMFATGDVSSARLFYERAVNSGDGAAALRLGETFDPDFLARIGYIGAAADRGKAVQWYRYARSLGIADADILLNTAETTANK